MQLMTSILRSLIQLSIGNTTDQKRSPLLKMKRPIKTVHLISGRVRFSVPAIKHRKDLANSVSTQLSKIQGIKSVIANPISYSIVILFDQKIIEAELLFAALIKILGLESELEKVPTPQLKKEVLKVINSGDQAIFDQTDGLLDLETAAMILLSAAALNKFFLAGQLWPAALSVLFWTHKH
jgi:copper chaperone CopZ